jgi:hypothetical protein
MCSGGPARHAYHIDIAKILPIASQLLPKGAVQPTGERRAQRRGSAREAGLGTRELIDFIAGAIDPGCHSFQDSRGRGVACPGHRGQRREGGGVRRRFCSGVHDQFP